MIRLERVHKSYDNDESFSVRDVSLHVEEGHLLVLVGESGSGKTTTLKMINRLVEPTRGAVFVGGRDVKTVDPVELRRGIGYVFQGIGLFPHMSVAENVAVVPRLLGWDEARIRARVAELLEMVGMPPGEYSARSPSALSGGQRQRIGLCRALAASPRIMLMDEPFGALDPLTRIALQDEFLRIHRALGLTTILVTHDMGVALTLADHIGVMQQGTLLQVGTPRELVTAPAHEYVKALLRVPRKTAERIEALYARGAGEEAGA